MNMSLPRSSNFPQGWCERSTSHQGARMSWKTMVVKHDPLVKIVMQVPMASQVVCYHNNAVHISVSYTDVLYHFRI